MQYRDFGKIDWKVSALGFGAMRLPILEGDSSKINDPLAIQMIRYAIDHGVNYVDSAYGYHRGNSEVVVGKALRDGYREKVRVATKMPVFLINSQEDMDHCFNEQLQKFQVEKIDFYLLHGLSKDRWPRIKDLGVFTWAEKKKSEGKIGYLGFSFHDEFSLFKEIVDSYKWDFCQIQYNYMDENFQAGVKGLKYAASKGMGVVIMEPIAGGRLAITPPPEILALWNSAKIKRKPPEWALQWVWNQPEVSLALSGMSNMDHVIENVASAERSGVNHLTEEELSLISKVSQKYRELGPIGCTGCRYCMPCPNGVSIPEIFGYYNEYFAKDRDNSVRQRYKKSFKPEQYAKNCIKCGKCEELCPQHLQIRDLLRTAGQTLESER
ncbi:aldo/keto reductase [Candidatus Bathyarchaeota archaeon]|nr:aldo/keto reductase [Candidatus Bathyarchaeota archaeon]